MRICSGAGCLRAIPDGQRFCDECKPDSTGDAIRNHTSGYDEELDKLRKSSRWQRLREVAIRKCPMCARCNERISEVVDHIIPAREAIAEAQLSGKFPADRYAGYFILSNLQGLCRSCHWAKTNEDKTHTGPWPSVLEADAKAPKKVWTF